MNIHTIIRIEKLISKTKKTKRKLSYEFGKNRDYFSMLLYSDSWNPKGSTLKKLLVFLGGYEKDSYLYTREELEEMDWVQVYKIAKKMQDNE